MDIQVPLAMHDRVITSFPWRDRIILVTERGHIFVMEVGEDFESGAIKIRPQP